MASVNEVDVNIGPPVCHFRDTFVTNSSSFITIVVPVNKFLEIAIHGHGSHLGHVTRRDCTNYIVFCYIKDTSFEI